MHGHMNVKVSILFINSVIFLETENYLAVWRAVMKLTIHQCILSPESILSQSNRGYTLKFHLSKIRCNVTHSFLDIPT
jgi:hypothetical protein